MKHGRRAQQNTRKARIKILQHPNNFLTKEDLIGNTVEQLKIILEDLEKVDETKDDVVS